MPPTPHIPVGPLGHGESPLFTDDRSTRSSASARAPTLRLLAALELLQSRGQLSGEALAARLQVDRRTVRRYIAGLEDMGVPIIATRGRDGGYALMPGFKLPPMMFNNEEALALGVGLQAARQLGLGDAAPAVASAQAKLERVMPDALRQRARAIDETVRVDAVRAQARVDTAMLATLSAAALRQQQVDIDYQARDAESTMRRVNPYGLAYYAGHWYLAGWCHLRRAMRSFRLDRMRQAAAVGASFARPPGFDALGYLKQSVAMLPRAHSFRVLLHTDLPSAQQALMLEFGMLEWAEGDAGREYVRLVGEAVSLGWIARELARLPFDFEIETPDALRDAVVEHAVHLQHLALRGRAC